VEEHWLAHWHPFLIPLTLALSRVLTKIKLAEYPLSVFSSDLCYFGVSFYVWALTVCLSRISVCPPERALARGNGERTYIILLLVSNFVCSFLFYPMTKQMSPFWTTTQILFALLLAVGSPLYLRARSLP
jgi:hypothetical protein